MAKTILPLHSSDRPVLVIGAAGLDTVGNLMGEIESNGSTPANIRVSIGGVARNVAENLARLGQPVRFVTAVGSDQIGEEILHFTEAHGVDISNSIKVEGQTTASYLAVYDTEGQRKMALDDMQIMSTLTPSYIRQIKAAFLDAALVFVDANLQPKTLKTIFTLAARAKIPVCADATTAILAERLLPYMNDIYLLTANITEASVINQNDPVISDRTSAQQSARQMVNQGVEIALITLAEFGVAYATSETIGHVPALRTKILDPTGAGDALTATVIFGILNEIPIDEAVRLGVTAASLILRYPGTVLPDLSLEKLYDELVI